MEETVCQALIKKFNEILANPVMYDAGFFNACLKPFNFSAAYKIACIASITVSKSSDFPFLLHFKGKAQKT
jgi:hypothetical protein